MTKTETVKDFRERVTKDLEDADIFRKVKLTLPNGNVAPDIMLMSDFYAAWAKSKLH